MGMCLPNMPCWSNTPYPDNDCGCLPTTYYYPNSCVDNSDCLFTIKTNCVIYNGPNLPHTEINTDDTVTEALIKIDSAFGDIASTYVPTTRTLTINGTTYDLSADRTWSVGVVTSIGSGAGISIGGTASVPIITNTAPDQTVVLTQGSGVTITGIYPNFTISATGSGGTVTNVTATAPLTSSGGTTPDISTSMATNKLIGRYSPGTGVFQEITISTGLSLDGSGNLTSTGSGGTVISVIGTPGRVTSTGGASPVIDIDVLYVGQTSITTLGTITTGTLSTGTVLGGVTVTLGSDSPYDIYYRENTGVLSRIANGTTGQVLTATTGVAPSYQYPQGAIGATVTSSTNYNALITDNIIYLTSISPRMVSLYLGSIAIIGKITWIKDGSFSAEANPITVQRTGFDLFEDTSTSFQITGNGDAVGVFWANGVWNVI